MSAAPEGSSPKTAGDAEAKAWMPSPAAIEAAADVFENALSRIDINNLSIGVPHGKEVPPHEGEGYANALIDLSRLLEDVRFEAAVGVLYAVSVRDELRSVRAKMKEPPHNLAFSNQARAMLVPYIANAAPPEDLISQPGKQMPGVRVLGGWWAGQLFDSAMMRGVAVLDRLVTLLFYTEGLPVDPDWTPAFRRRTLLKLTGWVDEPEWADLLALLDHEMFLVAKSIRDGLVHRGRYASELHGDFLVGHVSPQGHYDEAGFGPDVHFAIVAAFYNEVMRPAAAAVSGLVTRTMTARGYELPNG